MTSRWQKLRDVKLRDVHDARRQSEAFADGLRPRGASMAVFQDQGLQGGSVTTIEEVQLEALASAERRVAIEEGMSTEHM